MFHSFTAVVSHRKRAAHKHRLGLRYISSQMHDGAVPWVEHLSRTSLARECGIRIGDVIVAIDGIAVFDKNSSRYAWNTQERR